MLQDAGSPQGNVFDAKTEKGSSELYFHYYGQLQHQQNMLQDYIRTGSYYEAIMENKVDFDGKVVMDVGAGSGILSLFAAQVKNAYLFQAWLAQKWLQYQSLDSNGWSTETS